MQWLQGKTSETISPRWTLAVYSAPWLFSLRQVTLHLGLIKTLKCSKLDYQPDTGVTVASQIWGNRQQQSVRQSWVVMGGKSTNFRTGGPQAQCPKHATRRKFHPSHSIRKVRWHFANYPFRKKNTSPSHGLSPPPHGVQHPRASAAWDRNPHPCTALRGHQHPAFVPRGSALSACWEHAAPSDALPEDTQGSRNHGASQSRLYSGRNSHARSDVSCSPACLH